MSPTDQVDEAPPIGLRRSGYRRMPAMIIDVFSHVLPPRYLAERNKRAGTRLASQYGK